MTYSWQNLALAPDLEPVPQSVVIPRQIFVAGRQSFDAFVRLVGNENQIKGALFAALPLQENGWDRAATVVKRTRRTVGGVIVHVRRG